MTTGSAFFPVGFIITPMTLTFCLILIFTIAALWGPALLSLMLPLLPLSSSLQVE